MRATLLFSLIFLAYSAGSRAELGGRPETFTEAGATVVTNVASNYITHDITLAMGTHVREYISAKGLVFAVSWDGPFLPDMKAIMGKYFDMMTAESARTSKAGRPQLFLSRPEVVINSSGHMRAFEGGAWIPAELPADFFNNDER